MAVVVDCSVTLPWFLVEERTAFTDQLLDGIDRLDYWVPSLWRLEMLNGLLMAERRKRIDRAWRARSIDQIARLKVRVESAAPSISAIAALAESHALTAYDATYLELAKRQGFAIATLDRDLLQAAQAEGVPVHSAGRGSAAQKRRRYNV